MPEIRRYAPSPVGEGWGGAAYVKEKLQFMNGIINPHPNPPPLRASPCRGGDRTAQGFK